MNTVIDFLNTNRDRYVAELKTWLAIPSVSALPEHAADMKRCADWTADEMRRIGLENVRLIETPGNPVVYGDWLGAPGAPTILFYGHYDVQPVDPLELWTTPPFEATEQRRRAVRARGGRRQGPGVHALQGHRGPHEADRPPARERQVHRRGRGGSRQPEPRRLHPRPQGRAGRQRCRRVGLRDVRQGRAVALLRPARADLLPDRSARHEERPSFRVVWRGGGEPGVRAGAGAGADEGQERPHQDPGLLRRCAAAEGRGAGGVQAAAVPRDEVPGRIWARRGCSAKRSTRHSSARGSGRRSKSTGWYLDSQAKARRP